MIEELKKLIRFKTVVGNNKENKKALEWVKSEAGRAYHIKEFESCGYPSLVITTQKTKKPKIILAAHMDVAKAKKSLFIPKLRGNKLYGRGAYDMKYAIACYMRLMKEMRNIATEYDFGVMITSDEERGGRNGVNYLIKKGYGCEAVILPDGSEDWKIEKASKGVWCFVVKSYGKSAHPSMPWEAENALENLIEYLCELKKHFRKEPCGDPDHIHRTIDVNELNTGSTGDNLPDYAEAMLDIFFISEKERKGIMNIERNIRSRYAGLKITTTILNPSVKMPINNKYADLFYEISNKKYGIKKEGLFTHGTSDAHYFVEKGINVIETKPKGGGCHGNDEWVDVYDMNRFYVVMKEFVERTSRN